jgi:Flp pilus assembly protein TadD
LHNSKEISVIFMKNNPSENSEILVFNKAKWVLGVLVGLVAFILYFNTVSHEYVLDDFSLISENTVTTKGIKGIPTIFQNHYRVGYYLIDDGIYRPLSVAMFAIEWELSPNNPHLSHWLNVLFYAFTGWLLFITLSKLLKNYNLVIPFLISILFISHPVHTEVVANIKSRDELIGFFLTIASLYYMLKYFEKEKIYYLILVSFLFFGALLAKETAITMIGLLPVSSYIFINQSFRKNILPFIFLLVPVILFLIIRNIVLSENDSTYMITPLENLLLATNNIANRIATAINIMGDYILLLIYPNNLFYDRSFGQIKIVNFSDIKVILTLLFLIFSGVFCVVKILKKDLIAFGIFIFLVTMTLFSNFIFTIGVAMADRFLYFASLGFAFVIVMLFIKITKTKLEFENYISVSNFFKSNFKLFVFTVPIILFYSFRTIERNKDWKDNLTLFSRDVIKMPNNSRAHSFYANELIRTTEVSELDSNVKKNYYLEGIKEFKTSIAIYPKQSAEVFEAMGTAYLKLNKFDSAEYYYKKGIKLDPTLIKNLGDLYFAKCDYNKAIYFYLKQVKISPNNYMTWLNLGLSYGTLKKYDLALENFLKADQLKPNDPEINFLIATVYQFKNDEANYHKYYNKSVAYTK